MRRCGSLLRRASFLLAVLLAVPLRAQNRVARADTLLLAGRVFGAESLYYDAVRHDPRDPQARLALGRYRAARGALRVGAVLMEEARYFGGDAKTVAEQLAPVYARMGEYGALASLPASRLSFAERTRAEWLAAHRPDVTGPDSSVLEYRVSESQLLGRIMLHIGADSVLATIDARAQGLVLDTSWARRKEVKTFASRIERDPRAFSGVTLTMTIGELALSSVATSFAPHRGGGGASQAAIGLDLLGRLAPTFEPRAGRMVLHKSGRAPERVVGVHVATLTTPAGIAVVKGNTTFPIGHPDVQRYLHHSRWTLNPKAGEVIVDVEG